MDAIWPRRQHSRYEKTYVLLLSWEEDDLGVFTEIKRLRHVFEDRYHYFVDCYSIPSAKPDTALKGRVFEFLKHYDSKNALLIVYYAGHGTSSLSPGGPPLWHA